MAANVAERQNSELEISFSSLSVSPTRISPFAVIPDHVTVKTIQNMARLRKHLSQVADLSFSLHLGDLTDVPMAAEFLAKEGINITSLDRPDVYANPAFLKDILFGLKEMRLRDSLVTIGRRFHNVSTEKGANSKIQQGIEAIRAQQSFKPDHPLILRTHAGLWVENDGATGDRLRESLKGTGVVIAVEIFARLQTQSEYRELIEKLARDNLNNTPVYYDLDVGHIEESRFKHLERSEGKKAEAFCEEVLADQGSLVALTSLNQYQEGDSVTHRNFLNGGNVNYGEVARIFGQAVRSGRLSPKVLVVIESNPFEFQQWFSDRGTNVIANFQREFYQATGEQQIVFANKQLTY